MFEWLIPGAIALLNYIVVTVVLKYIVGKWVAEKVTDILRYLLIRTQRDAVSWLHFRERAMKHGHNYPSPELCRDGVCASYHKTKTGT